MEGVCSVWEEQAKVAWKGSCSHQEESVLRRKKQLQELDIKLQHLRKKRIVKTRDNEGKWHYFPDKSKRRKFQFIKNWTQLTYLRGTYWVTYCELKTSKDSQTYRQDC